MIGVLRRRRIGVALGRQHIYRVAPQPGAGIGVGGRGWRAACAAQPRTELASDRGDEATATSGVAVKTIANGMLPSTVDNGMLPSISLMQKQYRNTTQEQE